MDQQDLLAWPQEYFNEPRPSETQMFHPEKWPQLRGRAARGRGPDELTVLQYWDLAISEKTTADYTVGWTIGVSDENDIYILERRRGHFDFNRTLNEIADMGQAWPGVQRIGIEQVSYQAAAVQEPLRRNMLPIVPVKPDNDKVTRARLLEARAGRGRSTARPTACGGRSSPRSRCSSRPAHMTTRWTPSPARSGWPGSTRSRSVGFTAAGPAGTRRASGYTRSSRIGPARSAAGQRRRRTRTRSSWPTRPSRSRTSTRKSASLTMTCPSSGSKRAKHHPAKHR